MRSSAEVRTSVTSTPTPQFLAFTLRFNGRTDRLITDIAVTAAFDPERQPEPSQQITTRALWDTGASRSVIAQSVVTRLGLPSVGQTKVFHGGGLSESVPTYLVNYVLPNKVTVVGLLVTEFDQKQDGFDVIVGMDVINAGDFAVTHVDGKSCMSFRMPSCREVDYVAEAQAAKLPIKAAPKVGRNDPCPCGTKRPDGLGVKKFKNCCGAGA